MDILYQLEQVLIVEHPQNGFWWPTWPTSHIYIANWTILGWVKSLPTPHVVLSAYDNRYSTTHFPKFGYMFTLNIFADSFYVYILLHNYTYNVYIFIYICICVSLIEHWMKEQRFRFCIYIIKFPWLIFLFLSHNFWCTIKSCKITYNNIYMHIHITKIKLYNLTLIYL